MHSVVLTELGIVLLEDGRPAKSFGFSEPAGQYLAVRRGEGAPNELVRHLDGMNAGFEVSDGALLAILQSRGIDATHMPAAEAERVQASKISIMVGAGLASDERDAAARLRDFALSLSSARVAEISGSADLHAVQAIGALDEIDKASNALGSRLREWYGLHFPELENLVDSVAGYARVAERGRRSDLSAQSFRDAGFPEEKAQMLELVSRNSRGGDISDGSLAMAQLLAGQLVGLQEARRSLEAHLDERLGELAPNLSAVLGRVVAARLLSRAGSLQKLASMPSSTIQVLGAEKALFRSIKSGSDPPKHGLLFQHHLIHSAPRWQRGKIARTIAAKAAIAARVDAYGEGLNETLVESMNRRVGEIGAKYAEPPQRPAGGERRDARRPRADGRRPKGDARRHEASCDACGKKFDLPFRPKPGRRAYCPDCFEGRKKRHGKKRRR